jgi:hypothetical protein
VPETAYPMRAGASAGLGGGLFHVPGETLAGRAAQERLSFLICENRSASVMGVTVVDRPLGVIMAARTHSSHGGDHAKQHRRNDGCPRNGGCRCECERDAVAFEQPQVTRRKSSLTGRNHRFRKEIR